MLNKIEQTNFDKTLCFEVRKIYNLIKNENIKDAYIKYETVLQLANIFNKNSFIDDLLKEYLLRDFTEKNVNLFLDSFKASYVNYKENDFGIIDFKVLKEMY